MNFSGHSERNKESHYRHDYANALTLKTCNPLLNLYPVGGGATQSFSVKHIPTPSFYFIIYDFFIFVKLSEN